MGIGSTALSFHPASIHRTNESIFQLSVILFTPANNFYFLAGIAFMVGGCEIHCLMLPVSVAISFIGLYREPQWAIVNNVWLCGCWMVSDASGQ